MPKNNKSSRTQNDKKSKMVVKQTTNFKNPRPKKSKNLKSKSTSGENKEFQEAKKRYDMIFKNKAKLFSSGEMMQLESDKLTNEFFFEKGVNSTLKDLRKNGLNVPKNARALYEITDPDSQCKKCIGEPTDDNPCYICKLKMKNLENSGFYYDKNTKKTSFLWTGRQCEHIIPVLMMAIICGLCDYKGGKNPVSPEKSITRYFNKLIYAFPNEREKIEGLMEKYETWQRECWVSSYGWSHTECNMVKNEFPFLKFSIQWTDIHKPSIEVKDDIFKENLENLLRMLLLKEENIWCDMFRAVYKKDIFNILNSKYSGNNINEQVNKWIEDTIKRVEQENLQPLINHIKKNNAYFNISLSILKDTICESVGNNEEAIERILGADTIIAKLIHFSQNKLNKIIGHRGGAEPGSEMNLEPEMGLSQKNTEIIDLANILVNLSNLDGGRRLGKTTTIQGAEALLYLQSGESENAGLMTKENIKRLINGIFEDNDTSEIIAGAIYLMYLHNSNSRHNPYANAIQIVNEWMLGKGGDYEKEFNFLIKRIKAVYGEIIIKDHLITHPPPSYPPEPIPNISIITESIINVLKDVEDLTEDPIKEEKTIICGFQDNQFSSRLDFDDFLKDSSYTLTEIFDAINLILPKSMALQKKKKKHTKRKKKRKSKRKIKKSKMR